MPRNRLVANQQVYHIPSSRERISYFLDLNEVKKSPIHLVIAPDSDIDLLIQNGAQDSVIEVDIADQVRGKIQFAMFGKNKNLTWNASVGSNVQIDAAIADFTEGKGQLCSLILHCACNMCYSSGNRNLLSCDGGCGRF
jgi:hypothetical protein